MSSSKKISPQAATALEEALAVIYWKREHLQQFLKLTVQNSAILSYIDWSVTKRESVRELVNRMVNRTDLYGEDLLNLCLAVCDFNDFENLKFWDNDGSKTKKAKEAVNRLRNVAKGHLQLSKEKDESSKRRADLDMRVSKSNALAQEIETLRTRFKELTNETNFQKRGFALEKFLYDLFLLYELDPKGSFKTHGEQIDGAFTFDGSDYLLEAKWKSQVDAGQIAAFCHKVETKFKSALGLLVTIDGVTPQAISPYFKCIIIMDGFDLTTVLEGRVTLPDLLRKKRRRATETGLIYQNIFELES